MQWNFEAKENVVNIQSGADAAPFASVPGGNFEVCCLWMCRDG